MDSSELKRISGVAVELDKLVPRIGMAIQTDESPASQERLAALLKSAEAYLLETGPAVARTIFEPGPTRELAERFLRELPRRLRMIREAHAPARRMPGKVVPTVLEGRSSPSRAG
ncbi:MAG: hypothetical protein K2X62_08275 [Beijerinckiaceae bacterium]|nr:hypothetical protein [Beijerinckiaceae bacterium]MDO9441235.1 hypothetical protein [Beijerinckiaceae bacterium]